MDAELEANIQQAQPRQLNTRLKRQQSEMLKYTFESQNSLCNNAAFLKDLEDKEHLQQLDETAKEFAVLETQVRRYKEQLEKLKPLVESGRLEQGNIDKLLKDALVEPRVNVMKHNFYNKFCGRAGIELAMDGDEGMFIQESESMKSTICPVTQMEMEDPLRNASCGHTYSKKGIQVYLKRSSKQCPDGGCRQELSFDKLERDVEMEVIIDHSHRISEQQRSQAAAQNDENDAEEYVVE